MNASSCPPRPSGGSVRGRPTRADRVRSTHPAAQRQHGAAVHREPAACRGARDDRQGDRARDRRPPAALRARRRAPAGRPVPDPLRPRPRCAGRCPPRGARCCSATTTGARTAAAGRTPSTTCTRARAAGGTSGPTSSRPASGATTARPTGCCTRSAGAAVRAAGAAVVGGFRDHLGALRAAVVAVRAVTPARRTVSSSSRTANVWHHSGYSWVRRPSGGTLERAHGGLGTSTEARMTRDDVVLVGVDGSAASLHALDWAAAQARTHGWARPARLQLLAAVVHGGLARRRVRGAGRHRDPGGRQGGARRGDAAGVLDGRPRHAPRCSRATLPGSSSRCRTPSGSRSSGRGAAAGSRTGCWAPCRRPCPRTRTARRSSSRCGRPARRCPTTRRSRPRGPCSGSSWASTAPRRRSTRCGTRSARPGPGAPS